MKSILITLLLLPNILFAIESGEKPIHLADLDVTFISRTPRYERLRVSYHQRSDGMVGDVDPYLTAAEQAKKRGPAAGELVTFTAHVKNHGDLGVAAADYFWAIDGKVEKAGVSAAIHPDQEILFKLGWSWEAGAHSVSFHIDPHDVIPEISDRNNTLTIRTDALSFHFHVEKSLYHYFKTIKNSWGSYSWEDWAQSHITLMNNLFQQAVYPTTPEGIIERVYLDTISIHNDGALDPEGTHAPEDWQWDGRWGFKRDYIDSQFYEKNAWAIQNEWSLIHELGHQIGRIDLYCIDVTAKQNEINGEAYRSKAQWGMMHRGIYLPHDEVHFFCEHTAASLNRDKGVRRGHFGEYLLDIPRTNFIQLKDGAYQPLAGFKINIYQAEPHGYTEKKLKAPPKFAGVTGDNGLFELGANPFGEINNWGTNVIFLIEIIDTGQKHYRWLEIIDFNLEYWRGNKEKAIYRIIL